MISLYGFALVAAGQLAGAVSLPDDTGTQHALPTAGRPLLVVYEDQEGGKQNRVMKDLIAAYHDPIGNRARVAVWPIADLSRWNWWPAKSHALSDVQKSASKQNTRILIDWSGALHKAWGLARGKNSIVLIGSDGRVRYASEGETTAAQRAALEAELQALGLARP